MYLGTYPGPNGQPTPGTDYTAQITTFFAQVGETPSANDLLTWNEFANNGESLAEIQNLITGSAVTAAAGALNTATTAAQVTADMAQEANAQTFYSQSMNYNAPPVGVTVPTPTPAPAPPPQPRHNPAPSPIAALPAAPVVAPTPIAAQPAPAIEPTAKAQSTLPLLDPSGIDFADNSTPATVSAPASTSPTMILAAAAVGFLLLSRRK